MAIPKEREGDSIRVVGGRREGQNFYEGRPPICWWCKGKVSQEKAQDEIKDCVSFNQCREDWWKNMKQCKEDYWKTHKTNSNTTTPSNPKQEKKLGKESIEEEQQGSFNKDDPPSRKLYSCITCPIQKQL